MIIKWPFTIIKPTVSHITWFLVFRHFIIAIVIPASNIILLVLILCSCRWFRVIIYWILIFTVIVILLNLLIAQFNHTYDEANDKAQVVVTLTRAKLLYQMEYESNFLQWLFIQVCQWWISLFSVKHDLLCLFYFFQGIKIFRASGHFSFKHKLLVTREPNKGIYRLPNYK